MSKIPDTSETMSAPNIYRRGQFVNLGYCGQTIKAMVTLASENGRSLILMFDGALRTPSGGMMIGSMPLLYKEDGNYHDLAEDAVAILSLAQNFSFS